MFLGAGCYGFTKIKTINQVKYYYYNSEPVFCTRFLLCLVIALHLDAPQHSFQDAVTLPESLHSGGNHPEVKNKNSQYRLTNWINHQPVQALLTTGRCRPAAWAALPPGGLVG